VKHIGSWKWSVTIAVVAIAVTAAMTTDRWFSILARWVKANSETVQGLEALLQIALWTIGGVALLVRLWVTFGRRDDDDGTTSRGLLPPVPQLVVGRKEVLEDLKRRIRASERNSDTMRVVVVTGWPGVGKSTIAAALVHDPDVRRWFDGPTLWATLGSVDADVRSQLRAWGRAAGVDLSWDINSNIARAKLAAHLGDKDCLLIVDDVWSPDQVEPFRVGGQRSALVVTTRLYSVGAGVAPTPSDMVQLPGLTTDDGLELLSELAPAVVKEHRASCRELVDALQGLPLAIQVAARYLNAEARSGLDVDSLLAELRTGSRILEARPPTDMMTSTTPTVAVLLQKSTEHLDPLTLERFAALGVMAGQATSFDMAALQTLWNTKEPEGTVRTLIDRGLLEFNPSSRRYWVHSLLLLHARSLLRPGHANA
jgi:hypothetical protein